MSTDLSHFLFRDGYDRAIGARVIPSRFIVGLRLGVESRKHAVRIARQLEVELDVPASTRDSKQKLIMRRQSIDELLQLVEQTRIALIVEKMIPPTSIVRARPSGIQWSLERVIPPFVTIRARASAPQARSA